MQTQTPALDLQRRILDLDGMAAVCSYGPDKQRLRAQADALRAELRRPAPAQGLAPR